MKFIWRSGTVAVLVAMLSALSACGSSGSVSPQAAGKSIATAECNANKAAGQIKFFSVFGYDASAGILDVYAALKLGYFNQLCLNVTFNGSPGVEATAPTDVSAGAAQITGEGSAADALVAMANGAHFTAISTFGDTSDYALLTRSDITNLLQLEGKTLGYHSVLPVVLSEMLSHAGVDLSKVHEVNDNSYDPSVLIKGPYDALQAYQSNEPLTLVSEGYKGKFRVWTPAQFGVTGTFNVQVVNTNFLKSHRQAVADFLRAELHAFNYCNANVTACVNFAAQAVGKTYNTAHAVSEWKIEASLAAKHTLPGKGIGVQSTAEWTPELQALVAAKLVKHPPALSSAMDTTLAASLYHGKTLIWP